jgi:hypothetical protein
MPAGTVRRACRARQVAPGGAGYDVPRRHLEVLPRCRLNRLSPGRVTAEPVRRYEHQCRGDLLRVDGK